MKPYSEDLRWRVVASVEGDMSRQAAARVFQVSIPTIKRWLRRRRAGEDLAPKPVPGPPAVKGDALVEALPGRLAGYADATLEEHCSWWRGYPGWE
jgi:transposase